VRWTRNARGGGGGPAALVRVIGDPANQAVIFGPPTDGCTMTDDSIYSTIIGSVGCAINGGNTDQIVCSSNSTINTLGGSDGNIISGGGGVFLDQCGQTTVTGCFSTTLTGCSNVTLINCRNFSLTNVGGGTYIDNQLAGTGGPSAPVRDIYDVPDAVRAAVTGGTFTNGELQGTQPADSAAGMKFTTTTYGYEYQRGAGGTLVWCRYAKG
jgi:hypothetical protein